MTAEEAKAYCDFMYDRKNIRNCAQCPENHEYDSFQDRLPCGQWHCWVTRHCAGKEEP